MSSNGRKKYRTPAVVEIDRDYEREMHRLWCQVVDPNGHVPSEGIYDIRRHRQFPWRIWDRRELEAVIADAPEPVFEQMDALRRDRRRKLRELAHEGILTLRVAA